MEKLSEPHDPTACRSTFSSGAHTLNLEIADAAKSSPEAFGYFGNLTVIEALLSLHP